AGRANDAADAAGAAGATGAGRSGSFVGSLSLLSCSVTAVGSTDLAEVFPPRPGRCLGWTWVGRPRSKAGGSSTVAVVPPRVLRGSESVEPCRFASPLDNTR